MDGRRGPGRPGEVFQQCLQGWSKADVVGIFKKGSHRLPANYRPISLLEAAYKLLCRVIAARLQVALGPV
eukprot:2253470-Alexandrium_andersonii.AAC.1